ncbi:hypothetical protein NQ854_24855 [Rhodococcus ruber]|uniref:hypothetical protein n=1 Tax=Rhodococcus ruber TaxID=1830 RepID=UPI001EE3FC0C|nr:hypothetical protein [Rhodococcus ruber]
MKTTADLLTDAVIAPVAGYAATKVMEPVSMKLYQLESDETRRREDAARPGSPSQIAADKTLGLLGIHLDDKARERAGTAFHYGLAISWAPVYAGVAVVLAEFRADMASLLVSGCGKCRGR